MQEWCKSVGFPPITVLVKTYRDGSEGDLYSHSFDRRALPSLAYGFKNCSQKFKIEPQDKACNNHPPFRDVWAKGGRVVKMIGYDIDEPGRVEKSRAASLKQKKFLVSFPLFDEGMDREACKDLILREGLPLPGKSACYYCPASTLPEIAALRNTYPALYRAALDLEGNADLTTVKGLGRRFAWRDADLTRFEGVTYDADLSDGEEAPCGCFDN